MIWDKRQCKTRECRAAITFVQVEKSGKMMPIEFDELMSRPAEFADTGVAGRVVEVPQLDLGLDDVPVLVAVLRKGEASPVESAAGVWLSHFARCPGAEDWRGRNGW